MKKIAEKSMKKQADADYNIYSELLHLYLVFPNIPKKWQRQMFDLFDFVINRYQEAGIEDRAKGWTIIKQKFTVRLETK